MFKIMQMLRDLNSLRSITWEIEGYEMIVRIPVSEDDKQLVADLQELLG